MGVWLDWMAQGAEVKNNLMHDNDLDIFLEVNHGPMLVSNNVLLSKTSLLMNSSGAAFVHNLFAGKMDVIDFDARLTPYHKPHSSDVVALHDNPGGDVQFINNLFVNGGNASQYSKALLPVLFEGNVFTKGSVRPAAVKENQRFGEMDKTGKEKLAKYKVQPAIERNGLVLDSFDAGANLLKHDNGMYLEITLDKNWLAQKRKLVTTSTLTKAVVPNLPFELVDGTPFIINTDYFGKKRKRSNPSPGPFEISGKGIRRMKLW
jgi:alpha-N-arabinofuranosidase